MIPLDDIPNTQPLVRTDPDLSEWTAAMPWSKILDVSAGTGIRPLLAVSWGGLGILGEGWAAKAVSSSGRLQGRGFLPTIKKKFQHADIFNGTSAYWSIFSPVKFLCYEC